MKRLFNKNMDRTKAGLAFGREIDEFMDKMAKKAVRRGYDLHDATEIAYKSIGYPFTREAALWKCRKAGR